MTTPPKPRSQRHAQEDPLAGVRDSITRFRRSQLITIGVTIGGFVFLLMIMGYSATQIRGVGDSLAARIQGTEKRITQRLEAMSEALTKRTEGMDYGIDGRIDGIGTKLDDIQERLIRIKGKFEHNPGNQ